MDAITASDSAGGNDGTDGTTSGVDRLRLIRSERLPGAVVQARARLIERLRGISLTESRSFLFYISSLDSMQDMLINLD